MKATEISKTLLESIAPAGLIEEARRLLVTERFGRIITREDPLSIVAECGELYAGFAINSGGDLANICDCGAGMAPEHPFCAHSIAVVLEFHNRARERGEDLDAPGNNLSRRLLLPPDFFEVWGMAVLEVSWQLVQLRTLRDQPEGSPDRQLLALTHPSGTQRVHCSTMSSLFRLFHNSALVYLQQSEGEPLRVAIREEPVGLRVRLIEGESGTVELETSTGFADGKLLVTPFPGHNKMDREHYARPIGWIYRTEKHELLRLPEPADLNLDPDYDQILEAALAGKAVGRPTTWLAAYREELSRLFRFEETDTKLLQSFGDGSDYRPDIVDDSPPPNLRSYRFSRVPTRYWGNLPVKQSVDALESIGFVLHESFVQGGKHPDIYRGLDFHPNDDHKVRLSIWISVTSSAGQWSFRRPLFPEERGINIYHPVDTEEARQRLLERIIGALPERLDDLENDRSLELLRLAKGAIAVSNTCLRQLGELLDGYSEDPRALLAQITPEACKLVDRALSYRVLDTVYRKDHPRRAVLEFGAALLCGELTDEELAAEIDSGSVAHAAVLILADRIENFADDRVVPLVERAYLMTNPPVKDGPKRRNRELKSAACDGITFTRNIDEERERIGGTMDTHRLNDHLTPKSSNLVRQLCHDGLEAIWVQGRLLALFGGRYVSEEKRGSEKTIVDTDLVAELDSGETIGFNCCDTYGKSGLLFAPGEDPALDDRVARAFWDLLLSEPRAVKNFKGKIEHTGALCTLRFAIEGGAVFFGEGGPDQLKVLGEL